MEEKLKKIKALISKPDLELIESYENGELDYCDSGNFDDCFYQGVSVGHVQAIQSVINILEAK